MDAKIETKLFPEIYKGIDICKRELDKAVTTIKYEFRMANGKLEGEQFDVFSDRAHYACNSITEVLEQFNKIERYLKSLDNEITNYDRTRYN